MTSKLAMVVNAENVKERLQQSLERLTEPDADKIIEVRDGIATLTGVVRSLHERDDATRTAWSAPGVTGVQNLLTMG